LKRWPSPPTRCATSPLARLALTDDEVAELAPQLSKILEYAEHVGEVAAEDVPATTHPFPLHNVLRPDEPRPSLARDEVLAGAPRSSRTASRCPASWRRRRRCRS
jgi:aspartyl-tRNA(Asn)/glutamyl-tRNA(Gln) amidotransferase subunit C